MDAALQASPVKLSTMGRGLTEDHAYFITAAAAGRHAATLIPDLRTCVSASTIIQPARPCCRIGVSVFSDQSDSVADREHD